MVVICPCQLSTFHIVQCAESNESSLCDMSELCIPDDAQGHPIRLDSNGIYNAWEDIWKMMEWTKPNAW